MEEGDFKKELIIDPSLFDILACPIDKTDLKYNQDKTALICTKCGRKYQIENRIPILLPEDEKDKK